MKKLRRNRIMRFCSAAAAACVLACAVSAPRPAAADSLSDQYDALQRQQTALQSEIDAGSAKLKTDAQAQAALQSSINIIIQQTDILNNRISSLGAQINAKNAEIASTQAEIDRTYSLYKQQVRAMYESGDASYIKVLLSSDSFTDFLERAEVLRILSNKNNDMIDKLNGDKQKLTAEQASLSASQASLSSSAATLKAKQDAVSAQIEKQSMLMQSDTQNVSAKKSQQSAIDAQLNKIAEQQAAARRAQLEREAAEAAKKQSGGSSGGQAGGSAGSTAGGSSSSGGSSVSVTGSQIVQYIQQYIGCPYVLNTEGPRYFDCSGLTMRAFANVAGIALPHDANAQYGYGTHVSQNNLRAGDLVFFNTSGGYGYMSHVGIYVGNDQFIAANTSTGVTRCNLFSNSYWSRYYRGATRLI
jgi:cell wall-associated NlpC family hydrolase